MGLNSGARKVGHFLRAWVCVSFTTSHAISCYSLYERDCMKRPVFLSKCCKGECSAGMCVLRVDLRDEKLCKSTRRKNDRMFCVLRDVRVLYHASNTESTLLIEEGIKLNDFAALF